MNMFQSYTVDKTIMGRINKDDDLLVSINSFLLGNKIQTGKIEGIGAIQKGCIGFYNQDTKEYQTISVNKPMEVVSLIGNVSLKEGNPFAHCHISLADENGDIKGGHLMEGCVVFAFEFVVTVFDGSALIRGFDEETKLPLWKFTE